jgi:RNA recognition motif-containing protein
VCRAWIHRSRGAAFVEFQDGDDIAKCLALHHAKLGGRRINVEKTCGGRNTDVRAIRIKHIRNEQKIALSETIDGILKNYEKRGVFSMREINDKLMNRLYALTPVLVTEILEDFRKFKDRYSHTPVTLGMLHKLVSARDGGGIDVDQSKGQKFGSKFDQPKKRKSDY